MSKPKPQADIALQVVMKPVADLIPYARNARTHSDKQVAQIAGSIREFGFNNPVLIDESGTIIAGHGRVMAARKLGMTDVPTITLSHLNDSQRRAYILADNKLALNAGWDETMLKLELSDGVDLLGIFDDPEKEIEDELEKFEDDPESLVDIVLSVNEKWFRGAIQQIQPKVKKFAAAIEADIPENEIENLLMYVFLLRQTFKSTKRRFSITVPLAEPIWTKFAINPKQAILDFQDYLHAKYNG